MPASLPLMTLWNHVHTMPVVLTCVVRVTTGAMSYEVREVPKDYVRLNTFLHNQINFLDYHYLYVLCLNYYHQYI